MDNAKTLITDLNRRMDATIHALEHDLKGLRTGRASTNLLDSITVEAYGDRMPISQIGTINAPEARMLVVQVWDASLVKTVEKAIINANLGLNPNTEGQTIRLPLPNLSEDRRKELVKVAHEYGEKARIAVRNIRRDGMEQLKKMEKDNIISEDAQHTHSEEIQKITENFNKKIDNLIIQKEKDIMVV